MISYLICTSPRTGSNLLCEALTRTGAAGAPQEYFKTQFQEMFSRKLGIDPGLDYLAYLRAAIAQTSSGAGVFGAKVMLRQLAPWLDRLRAGAVGETDRAVIEKLLPGVRIILLTRASKLRQAISFSRAKQTDAWVARHRSSAEPAFHFAELEKLVVRFEREEAAWKSWCIEQQIEPFPITYEQLTADYEETVAAVLRFVGTRDATILPPERSRPQSDALNDEWTERYETMRKSSWLARWRRRKK